LTARLPEISTTLFFGRSPGLSSRVSRGVAAARSVGWRFVVDRRLRRRDRPL